VLEVADTGAAERLALPAICQLLVVHGRRIARVPVANPLIRGCPRVSLPTPSGNAVGQGHADQGDDN
jgi:hypothetical protein